MNKTLKIILIVLAVPVVLLIVAAVALKLYFTSDRLKALIIPKVEQTLERDVAVGDVSLTILPRLGVKMENLAISNPRGQEFAGERFITLDQLLLDVQIMPLLSRELRINEIILHRPDLYLEVNEAGQANFAMPEDTARAEAEPPPEGEQQAFALFLNDFQINDGRIEYVDRKEDTRALIQGLDQAMSVTLTDGGKNARLESRATIDTLSYGSTQGFLISGLPLESYQLLYWDGNEGVLTMDSVRLAVRELVLSGKGTMSGLPTQPGQEPQPVLDFTLQSAKTDLADLLSLVPPEMLKASQGMETSGQFQFAMSAQGPVGDSLQPDVAGTFSVENGSIRYQDLPKAITGITLAGAFEQPGGRLNQTPPGKLVVDRFAAELGTSTLTGEMSVVNFQAPTLAASFNGAIKLDEVKEYYPLEPGTDLGGTLQANLNLNGPATDPNALRASGRLEFQRVTVQTPGRPEPLRNLNGVITFNNQVVNADQLSLLIGQSDLALSFTLRNYLGLVMPQARSAARPTASLTLRSKLLRTEDIMTPGKEEPAGDEAPPAQAALPDVDIDANVTIDRLITGKFEFANARGAVEVRNGVINLNNLSLNAFGGAVVTKGRLDLRPQQPAAFDLNLDIRNVQANSLLSNFTSFGTHLFGQFSMSTSMKGALNDTLGLNPQTLAGEGRVEVDRGRLTGYPLTSALANYTGVSELAGVEFSDWSNAFSISQGRLTIPELKVDAQVANFVLSGSQGLDGSLDYDLTVRLPESLSNQLKISGLTAEVVNLIKDKDNRIPLQFDVGGTATNPKLSLDMAQIQQAAQQALEQRLKQEAQEQGEQVRKQAEEELKEKAEEQLQRLFGK